MTKYQCGHESEILVLDGTPTMVSAYQRWSKSVGLYGDQSMCFRCWYEKNVQASKEAEVP